jgi:hypothetical protein
VTQEDMDSRFKMKMHRNVAAFAPSDIYSHDGKMMGEKNLQGNPFERKNSNEHHIDIM